MTWWMQVLAVVGYLLVGGLLAGVGLAVFLRDNTSAWRQVHSRSDLDDQAEKVAPTLIGAVLLWPIAIIITAILGFISVVPAIAWLLLRRRIIARDIAKKLEGEDQPTQDSQQTAYPFTQSAAGIAARAAWQASLARQVQSRQLNLPFKK